MAATNPIGRLIAILHRAGIGGSDLAELHEEVNGAADPDTGLRAGGTDAGHDAGTKPAKITKAGKRSKARGNVSDAATAGSGETSPASVTGTTPIAPTPTAQNPQGSREGGQAAQAGGAQSR